MPKNYAELYQLETFEYTPVTGGSAAPKKKTEEPQRHIRIVETRETEKTGRKKRAYTFAQNGKKTAVKIAAVAIAVILGIGVLAFNMATLFERSNTRKAQKEYSQMMADSARLSAVLEGEYSEDKVSEYAENELGMIKKEDAQLYYVTPEAANSQN